MLEKGKMLKNFVIIGILAILVIPMTVYGKGTVEYFDSFFEDNKFVINSDVKLDKTSLVFSAIGDLYVSEAENVSSRLAYKSCDDSGCSFYIERTTFTDDGATYETVKEYDDIDVVINTDIADEFAMVKDDVLIINFDKKYLNENISDDSLIWDELYNYSTNNVDYYRTSWSINDEDYETVKKVVKEDGQTTAVYIKYINSVSFENVETPFSDEYKQLIPSNTMEIKSNVINEKMINKALTSVDNGFFQIDSRSKIVDNKAYVVFYNYSNNTRERHLITFRQGEIDETVFNKYYGDKIEINLPSNSDSSSIRRVLSYYGVYNYSDGYALNLELDEENNNIIISYYLTNNSGNRQYKVVPYELVGYSKEYSDEFATIKDGILIRFESKTTSTIQNLLDSDFTVLSCNDDYSMCEIGYKEEVGKYEIHNVKVTWSTEISDNFKKVFELDKDNKFTIIADKIPYDYLYFSSYENDISLSYSCSFGEEGATCTLTIYDYNNKSNSESHVVEVNFVESGRSKEYSDTVLDSITVYPGEDEYVWNSLYSSKHFASNHKSNEKIRVAGCNQDEKACSVAYFSNAGLIEIHDTKVTVKEGISPEFKEAFPDNKLAVNAIYMDDAAYLDAVITNALRKVTMTDAYFNSNIKDGKSQIVFDGVEYHTIDITFAKEDKDIKTTVNSIANDITDKKVVIPISDLEFAKYMVDCSSYDIKSETINNTLDKLITNEHISYKVSRYYDGDADRSDIVPGLNWVEPVRVYLYYDGIAYGYAKNVTIKTYNVIYIPENTENTVDAYAAAAKDKLLNYFGKDKEFNVKFEDIGTDIDVTKLGLDAAKWDGNIYFMSYGSYLGSNVVIYKNDVKAAEKPVTTITDEVNNIKVETTSGQYSGNVVLKTEYVDVESKEFKTVVKKLGVKEAVMLDLSFVDPENGVVTEFDGEVLKVSVPLTNSNLLGKDLAAYYVDENGKIVSEHLVTVKDGIATFETTHFSNYVITEKVKDWEKIDAPDTFDAIGYFVILAVVAVAGVVGSVYYLKKKNN